MRKTTLLLLILMPLWLMAQEKMNVVSNETQTDYAYSNLHKLSFEDDAFTIHFKDGTSETFSFADIEKLMFDATVPTGIETNAITAINLFPNPVDEVLEVRCDDTGITQLTIVDLQGKKIFSQSYNFDVEPSHKIDVSHFISGIYLIQLSNGKTHKTQLFIKK